MQQSPYYKNRYRSLGGAVWTNRAIDLLIERGADQDTLAQVLKHPETVQNGQTPDIQLYKKRINAYNYTLIVKKGANGELLVLSWSSSPPYGSAPSSTQKDNDPFIIKLLKGIKYIAGF